MQKNSINGVPNEKTCSFFCEKWVEQTGFEPYKVRHCPWLSSSLNLGKFVTVVIDLSKGAFF